MTAAELRAEARSRLRPHLKLVDGDHGDLTDVGRRIRDVDDTLFVAWNALEERYEVHCILHRPDTLAWPVPWDALDGRVLEKARHNRVGRVSVSEWLREVDDANDKVERSAERDFENFTQSFARHHRPLFKKAADDLAKGVSR